MKSNKSLHIRLAKREQISGFARFLCMTRQGLYKALKTGKRNLWADYIEFMRKESYMLGQKIYYIDLDENNVYDGVVTAEMIDHNGYRSYRIHNADGDTYKIKPYVYPDKESAKAALEVMFPKAEAMRKLRDEAQAKIDAMRLELNGKPEFDGEKYNGKTTEETD